MKYTSNTSNSSQHVCVLMFKQICFILSLTKGLKVIVFLLEVSVNIWTDLYLSEQFWLATGLQILERLTPETVLWIQQNPVRLLPNESANTVKLLELFQC